VHELVIIETGHIDAWFKHEVYYCHVAQINAHIYHWMMIEGVFKTWE